MMDNFDQERDVPATAAFSRRTALVQSTAGVAALACALSGCATSKKIQGSAPQAEAQYQDRPSGLERCGVCKHFIPVTGCEIVAAPVQANGWCKYYALF
jgi:hypothetical protein